MTNTENETTDSPARRELRLMLAAEGHWPGPIEQKLDAYRAEVLAEAIEAARGEHFAVPTNTAKDVAYSDGVSAAVTAIAALLLEKK